MTYYPDLSPFRYGLGPAAWRADGPPGVEPGALYHWDCGEGAFAVPELNVGWLDRAHAFPRGATAPELVEKLERLCRASRYHQTRGWHHCPFCDDVRARGSAEIRVAGRTAVYAAPTLVGHYVAAHQYAPPAGFIDALRACDGLAVPDSGLERAVPAELIPREPVPLPALEAAVRADLAAGYQDATFPELSLRDEGERVVVFARIVPRPGRAPVERTWRVPRAAFLNLDQAVVGITTLLNRARAALPDEPEES